MLEIKPLSFSTSPILMLKKSNRWATPGISHCHQRRPRVTLGMWRVTTLVWIQKDPSTHPQGASALQCQCLRMACHQVSEDLGLLLVAL